MSKRDQIGFYSLDDLVPQEHLLRNIDKYFDFKFINELVEDKYDENNGRPSLDPVLLIKLPLIQYLYGIKSMRQTIERLFGTAKEFHGLRYTNMIGKEKMHMKIGLTFACLNIKKLAKTLKLRDQKDSIFFAYFCVLIQK